MIKFQLTILFILLNGLVFGQKMYGGQSKQVFPIFNIDPIRWNDPKSEYYFQRIEDKVNHLDTTVTAEQIISLTKSKILKKEINPTLLDSLANRAYKLNEDKKYSETITLAKTLLERSPNNISGHKEIALAYKKVGNDSLSNLHFQMLVKIITSVFKYGDGSYDYPFLVNNFFEGVSIYEAAFRTKPKKMTLMLDKRNRLLGAYNGYSSAMDEILIKYTELSHWRPFLSETDYIIEGR